MTDSPGWRINFEPISLNLQVEKKKGTSWQPIPFLAFFAVYYFWPFFPFLPLATNRPSP
jgi:hypothetical protein